MASVDTKNIIIGNNIVLRYRNSDKYSLNDCYKSFSYAKLQAYKRICYQAKSKNGTAVKILSYNVNFFTTAFLYEQNGTIFVQYDTAYRSEIYPTSLTLEQIKTL